MGPPIDSRIKPLDAEILVLQFEFEGMVLEHASSTEECYVK